MHHFKGPAQLYHVEVSDCAQHHSIQVPSGTALSNLTSVMAFFFSLLMLCILCLPPSFQDRDLKNEMVHLGYFERLVLCGCVFEYVIKAMLYSFSML